ncbi:unnamed protein product [Amoebophrya sp. A25]|nr:unnamed protein product [Amoebophrya sp. A25]|eukprot:GSA25T00013714001.1
MPEQRQTSLVSSGRAAGSAKSSDGRSRQKSSLTTPKDEALSASHSSRLEKKNDCEHKSQDEQLAAAAKKLQKLKESKQRKRNEKEQRARLTLHTERRRKNRNGNKGTLLNDTSESESSSGAENDDCFRKCFRSEAEGRPFTNTSDGNSAGHDDYDRQQDSLRSGPQGSAAGRSEEKNTKGEDKKKDRPEQKLHHYCGPSVDVGVEVTGSDTSDVALSLSTTPRRAEINSRQHPPLETGRTRKSKHFDETDVLLMDAAATRKAPRLTPKPSNNGGGLRGEKGQSSQTVKRPKLQDPDVLYQRTSERMAENDTAFVIPAGVQVEDHELQLQGTINTTGTVRNRIDGVENDVEDEAEASHDMKNFSIDLWSEGLAALKEKYLIDSLEGGFSAGKVDHEQDLKGLLSMCGVEVLANLRLQAQKQILSHMSLWQKAQSTRASIMMIPFRAQAPIVDDVGASSSSRGEHERGVGRQSRVPDTTIEKPNEEAALSRNRNQMKDVLVESLNMKSAEQPCTAISSREQYVVNGETDTHAAEKQETSLNTCGISDAAVLFRHDDVLATSQLRADAAPWIPGQMSPVVVFGVGNPHNFPSSSSSCTFQNRDDQEQVHQVEDPFPNNGYRRYCSSFSFSSTTTLNRGEQDEMKIMKGNDFDQGEVVEEDDRPLHAPEFDESSPETQGEFDADEAYREGDQDAVLDNYFSELIRGQPQHQHEQHDAAATPVEDGTKIVNASAPPTPEEFWRPTVAPVSNRRSSRRSNMDSPVEGFHEEERHSNTRADNHEDLDDTNASKVTSTTAISRKNQEAKQSQHAPGERRRVEKSGPQDHEKENSFEQHISYLYEGKGNASCNQDKRVSRGFRTRYCGDGNYDSVSEDSDTLDNLYGTRSRLKAGEPRDGSACTPSFDEEKEEEDEDFSRGGHQLHPPAQEMQANREQKQGHVSNRSENLAPALLAVQHQPSSICTVFAPLPKGTAEPQQRWVTDKRAPLIEDFPESQRECIRRCYQECIFHSIPDGWEKNRKGDRWQLYKVVDPITDQVHVNCGEFKELFCYLCWKRVEVGDEAWWHMNSKTHKKKTHQMDNASWYTPEPHIQAYFDHGKSLIQDAKGVPYTVGSHANNDRREVNLNANNRAECLQITCMPADVSSSINRGSGRSVSFRENTKRTLRRRGSSCDYIDGSYNGLPASTPQGCHLQAETVNDTGSGYDHEQQRRNSKASSYRPQGENEYLYSSTHKDAGSSSSRPYDYKSTSPCINKNEEKHEDLSRRDPSSATSPTTSHTSATRSRTRNGSSSYHDNRRGQGARLLNRNKEDHEDELTEDEDGDLEDPFPYLTRLEDYALTIVRSKSNAEDDADDQDQQGRLRRIKNEDQRVGIRLYLKNIAKQGNEEVANRFLRDNMFSGQVNSANRARLLGKWEQQGKARREAKAKERAQKIGEGGAAQQQESVSMLTAARGGS